MSHSALLGYSIQGETETPLENWEQGPRASATVLSPISRGLLVASAGGYFYISADHGRNFYTVETKVVEWVSNVEFIARSTMTNALIING